MVDMDPLEATPRATREVRCAVRPWASGETRAGPIFNPLLQGPEAAHRHPGGAVRRLQVAGHRQRGGAVEEPDVVEPEEAALGEVAALAALPVDPPGDVEQQLVEDPLQEGVVAVPGDLEDLKGGEGVDRGYPAPPPGGAGPARPSRAGVGAGRGDRSPPVAGPARRRRPRGRRRGRSRRSAWRRCGCGPWRGGAAMRRTADVHLAK